MNGEAMVKLQADLSHLPKRHGLVSFVIEVQGAASMGLIPHKAIEGNNRAVLTIPDVLDERCKVNDRVEQFKAIIFGGGAHSVHALQPPLTGGRNAISSSAERRVSQEANS